jgi:aspartate--ammonia ligase
MADKKADLAGPGIGSYAELETILPGDYRSLLSPRDTQKALMEAKDFIETGLCKALNLMRVTVPLIVDAESGVNDLLDRDGSRTPIQFHISNDRDQHPIDAQVVQAATKWKRIALKQFGMGPGEGLLTDMRAVRKDYFLDHDHSAYVDQWDWELAITPEQRTLGFLTEVVEKIWTVLRGAEAHVQERFPRLKDSRYPNLPGRLAFLHAEDILKRYPDLPRRCGFSRSIRPSSSTESAGPWRMGILTRCGPRTTTTGSPRRGRRTVGRCTASTATSWSGTR